MSGGGAAPSGPEDDGAGRQPAPPIPWRQAPPAEDGWDDEPEPRCPQCGSQRLVSYHPFAFWVLLPAVLPMLVLSVVLLPLVPFVIRLLWVRKWYCIACRHRWK